MSLQNDRIAKLEITQAIIKGKETVEEDSDYSSYCEEEKVGLSLLNKITYQKWYIKITLVKHQEYIIRDAIALVDSGADLNCIQEGLIPTKYFEKSLNLLLRPVEAKWLFNISFQK